MHICVFLFKVQNRWIDAFMCSFTSTGLPTETCWLSWTGQFQYCVHAAADYVDEDDDFMISVVWWLQVKMLISKLLSKSLSSSRLMKTKRSVKRKLLKSRYKRKSAKMNRLLLIWASCCLLLKVNTKSQASQVSQVVMLHQRISIWEETTQWSVHLYSLISGRYFLKSLRLLKWTIWNDVFLFRKLNAAMLRYNY